MSEEALSTESGEYALTPAEEPFVYTEKGHEKTIGHHIMDRKRLRIFQTITKPPKSVE